MNTLQLIIQVVHAGLIGSTSFTHLYTLIYRLRSFRLITKPYWRVWVANGPFLHGPSCLLYDMRYIDIR